MSGWWRWAMVAGWWLVLAHAAWAAPGDLDVSFDGDGLAVTVAPDEANAVIVQPDRRIVIAGVSSHAVLVRRYLENGSADPSFGTGGQVRTPVGTVAAGYALARQPDGKLLVAGSTDLTMLVLRFDTSGALDPTFGANGMATTTVGDRESAAYAIVVQPDGSIAVAGATRIGARQGFAVLRYRHDGSLDPGFGGGDGIETTAFGTASSVPFALARQADGKLVAGGITAGDIAVARYDADGALDPTFSGDGRITVDLGGTFDTVTSLVVQPSGRIVTVGRADTGGVGRIALAGVLPNGDLDPTFDADGVVSTFVPGSLSSNATGLAIQPDGRLVAGGTARFDKPAQFTVEDSFLAIRYRSDGSLDPSFGGGDGIATTPIGVSAAARDMALADDGRIVLAGSGSSAFGYGIILARYLGDQHCGNGAREGSEACDDGNTESGDCCSAACEIEAIGSPCLADDHCTTGTTCDGAGSCSGGAPVICDACQTCDAGTGCTGPVCTTTPAATLTNTATPTHTPTATASSTMTHTVVLPATATATASETATTIATATASATATATPSVPSTASRTPAATATGTPTGTPTATLAAGCPATPLDTCDGAGRSSLAIGRAGNPAHNQLLWRWKRGAAALTQASFGDPVGGRGVYTLCLYDDVIGAPQLKLVTRIAAGGACGTLPCWRRLGQKGWAYSDKAGVSGGITKLHLLGGNAGKPRLQARGKGIHLELPPPASATAFFAQDPSVIIQLHASDTARCWTSGFAPSSTTRNDGSRFKSQSP